MTHIDDMNRKLSSEQAEFFRDSVVRDDAGNLLTMYHGSTYDFDVFDTSKIRASETDAPYNGFWFSDDKYTLPAWTRLNQRFEVYINLKKPAPMDLVRKMAKEIQLELKYRDDVFTDGTWHKESRSTCDELRYRLRDMGYDGIIHDWIPKVDREELEATGSTKVVSTRGTQYLLKDDLEGGLELYYYDPDELDHCGEHLTGYEDVDDYLRLQTRTVVVFDPNQIKLTANRTPTLDPNFKHNEIAKEQVSSNSFNQALASAAARAEKLASATNVEIPQNTR